MLLRIILSKDDIRKIQIDSLPETLDEFYSFLKSKLGLEGDLVVQYEDREFDNELCNLVSLSDLPEGKATLKITVKQARLAEAMYSYTAYPSQGRTQNVLEKERLAIMEEMKNKKAVMKKVNEMMAGTFSLRRKQIVEEPPVADSSTLPSTVQFAGIC